jgi:ribosomal-protein-serine acetyltransferase
MIFENYTIRLLAISDLEPYYDLVERNRKRLESFFTGTTSRTATFSDTRDFLIEMVEKTKARTYFPYIFIDNTDDRIIGFLDIKNIDWSIPKAELGCYVDEQSSGKGITGKALVIFTDYCFKEYGFLKLFLRTHPDNTAAIKLAEKCGFELEGRIRRDYKTTSGEIVDLLYYGRLS